MNQDLLERGVTSVVTRRTIVRTGVKLAYAAPLVAVTMKVSGSSVFAASGGGTQELEFCGHSLQQAVGDDLVAGGCQEACRASGCTDGACTNACADLCPTGSGGNNPCSTLAACDPANYTCFDCDTPKATDDVVCFEPGDCYAGNDTCSSFTRP